MPPSIAEFIEPYRVTKGKKFRLKDYDPGDTAGLGSEFKGEAKELMQRGLDQVTDLQDKLYAQNCWALLLVFQAMDAAGKDGVIKHVMSGVNPQGVQVHSFKAPSSEELDHDFLWRTTCRLPERGRIGIFNRSYYEEVLIVKVHSDFLAKQQLPQKLITDDIWKQRYEDIESFERYLTRNGVCIRKFFLNISKKEQKKRFLARLDRPEKNWKFSAADIRERKYWDDYMDAYEQAIEHTATKHAPWFVVPADNKWFTRLVVMAAVVDALQSLDVEYPQVTDDQRKALQAARAELEQSWNGPMKAADLLPVVYDELRKLAAARLAHERPGQTLTATALVHEAYVRLVANPASQGGGSTPPGFANQPYFFAAAAEAMRRILIERARQKRGPQRGGGRRRIDLIDAVAAVEHSPDELLDLDAALTRLAEEDEAAADCVKLRLYAGLSVEEAAVAMGVSRAAAYRHWTYARAWLQDALGRIS